MNLTIFRLATQALLGSRRGLVMTIIPIGLLALALVIRLLTGGGADAGPIIGDLGLSLALPLVALLAATATLGPEIDDGSVVYLLAKPINRYVVAISKYAAALLVTWGLGAFPLFAAALILNTDQPGQAFGYLLGGMLAGASYTGLFLALCAMTRHSVVVGLLFAFLWESVLGNILTGVERLSPASWGARVAEAVAPELFGPDYSVVYAVLAGLVLAGLTVWFAGRRLSSFVLTGDE